jgi:hypothetical protein
VVKDDPFMYQKKILEPFLKMAVKFLTCARYVIKKQVCLVLTNISHLVHI